MLSDSPDVTLDSGSNVPAPTSTPAAPDLSSNAPAFTSSLAAPGKSPTACLYLDGSALLQDRDPIELFRALAKLDREDPIVDVPGVGACVQSPDGVPFLLGSSPEPLLGLLRKEEKREALLIQLLFGARELAARTVEAIPLPFDPASPQLSELFRCRECRRAGYVFETIRHTKKCHAGRMLRVIEELSLAKGPKTARPCPACGATDEAWATEEKPASEVDLTALQPNQGASAEVVDGMRTVRTHLCATELNAAGGIA